MNNYLRIARVDHWIKNLFIIPGVVAAEFLLGVPLSDIGVLSLVLAFGATCLAASANYVVNEWLDAPFDRFHPTKKNRPAVVDGLRPGWVVLEYAILASGSLLLSAPLNGGFRFCLVWLLVMGGLYNVRPFRTKDIPVLDVLSESVNNMIRLLLGWFVVTADVLPPASILLGYWMGGAFLMAVKRFAEYRMIADPAQAGSYRKSFRFYRETTLLDSAFFYAMASTFFSGIFLVKYRMEYLLAMPLMFGLFSMYLHIAFKADSAVQKPEKLYREKRLMLCVGVFVAALVALTYCDIPLLYDLFANAELKRLR